MVVTLRECGGATGRRPHGAYRPLARDARVGIVANKAIFLIDRHGLPRDDEAIRADGDTV